jgi:predicted enzyme related to lactoylglutathione lyase
MIQGLRTASYPVTNITEATEWYRKVLQVDPYFVEPFYVGFNVAGFELGLVPDGTPGAQGVTAYWGTQDADAEVARLVELGAVVDTPITDVGGDIRIGTVRDPFGNLFGLVQNPHYDPAKAG